MQRILCLIIVPVMLISSCKKKSDCTPDTYMNIFSSNAKVDTSSSGTARLRAFPGTGNKMLFSYLHAHSPCKGYIDEGVTYGLIFETTAGIDHFKLYGDDLGTAHCYFTYSTSGNGSLGAYTPVGGIIEGTRLDNRHWKINIDLKLTNQTLTSSTIFSVQ